jgi:ribosomal protein S18 acetylase RimI-like enzyme
MGRVKSVRVLLTDPEVVPLLDALQVEYRTRYGPIPDEVLPTAEFDAPDGAFLVLLNDAGETVAGGGIRRYNEISCEVKRVWTHADYRRQGLAIRVINELEDVARELGYERVRLETGPAQPEAQALYRRLGYTKIETYGHYAQATGFERVLTPPAA